MEKMADVDAPAWETSKENVAPRKGGRAVEKLKRTFGAALANPEKEASDGAAKERHEAAIAAATDSEDPLAPWVRYIAWLEETFPTDAFVALEVRLPPGARSSPGVPTDRGDRFRSASGARGASRTTQTTETMSGTLRSGSATRARGVAEKQCRCREK